MPTRFQSATHSLCVFSFVCVLMRRAVIIESYNHAVTGLHHGQRPWESLLNAPALVIAYALMHPPP